ncbi:MAG: PucR family transcriptional regulator [Streptosporangiaceae bacterium]
MGTLGTAAMTRMEETLPWFREMSAEHRSWIGLVAQAGIAAFVDWFKRPGKRLQLTGEVFGTAPRELVRAVSLRQTVDLIRVVIEVVESQVDDLAAPGGEAELREAVLRYSREIAFAAAQVYAQAAEARGAWDSRLEALVVDALLRGEVDDGMHSWAAALGWGSRSVAVVTGRAPQAEAEAVVDDVQRTARHAKLDLLAGVRGSRLVVIVGDVDDPLHAARELVGRFGPGPVVVGPKVSDLHDATQSARAALAGLRAALAWTEAPRPVLADDLLPERALEGDDEARRVLVADVYGPLHDAGPPAGPPLLDTLAAYLAHASSVEATARMLFVHPNTVRYRLRRIAEMTGYPPTDSRAAFVLHIALILGRLAESQVPL